MTSIIGFNTQLRYLKNPSDWQEYNKRIAPAYNLAYVDNVAHLPYARDYANSQPGKTVVRLWHDLDGAFFQKPTGVGDTRYYIASPQSYLDQYGEYGTGNMILSILNEPNGFAELNDTLRRVAWLSELLTMAARRKIQLCVYNWGDRHPKLVNSEWDSADDDILRIMAGYPDLFYMGIHLYGPDDIIPHLEGYIKRCATLGIKPNKIIISEFGLDSTGAQENGYKSRQWTGKQYADWQIGQVKKELRPYIERGEVVGLCVFCAGNSGGWHNFDIEPDNEYRTAIETAAKMGELEPVTTSKPQPVAPPFEIAAIVNNRYTLRVPGRLLRKMYKSNTPGSEVNGTVPDGAVVTVIDKQFVSGDWWVKISYQSKDTTYIGWITTDGGIVKFNSLTSEFPAVPAPTTPAANENTANGGLQPITVLTRADIQKQIIFKELELAQLRDMLSKAA